MLSYLAAPPHAALRGVVLRFSQRRCRDAHRQVPAFGLPARTDQFIEFYLGEPVQVAQGGGAPSPAPEIVLVAPHTRPGTRLQMWGDIDTFTVHFQPTGLHRLFGLPLQGLTDQGLPAVDVLDRQVLDLRDALAAAPDFAGRVAGAQAWLAQRLLSARAADGLDLAALRLAADTSLPLRTLAQLANCSERHLHRRLVERCGVAPKLFARLLRFQGLLAAQRREPTESLTALALQAGYFDQAHCIRDCREFTGQAPRAFLAAWPDLGAPS